ncbi:MAG: SDR family NAD(P)-dependent oxidoreductase [Candidatus Poribacteria bacterium]|nr:SDR family NAD(P)-dependent oxidoreductase [Candidatus Poribacteria bacterium]MDE0503368.1 SDR family NAD(P)-dependent oxidoreductase [Candidatus Poribacteria bacterium]
MDPKTHTGKGYNMYDISGKIALVTGAGGEFGIGRAIAMRLADEGADLVVTDLTESPYTGSGTDWAGLPQLVDQIRSLGRRSIGIATDVSEAIQVEDMIQKVIGEFGRIDILVNNAGAPAGPDRVPLTELDEPVWDHVQRVNVKGTFLCCKATARHMIDRGGGGKIINMSSRLGKRGEARHTAYCASKFAIIGFTQSLAMELAVHRINVNALCPGMVDTERIDTIASALVPGTLTSEEKRRELVDSTASDIPLGRIAQSAEVASTAAYLASSQSDYLTGLAINIAGGLEMG